MIDNDVAFAIYHKLNGMPVAEACAVLGRVLIHVCMTHDYAKDEAFECLSNQWDFLEPKYAALKQERIARASPN